MEGNQRGVHQGSRADSCSLSPAGSRPRMKSIFGLALRCLGHLHPTVIAEESLWGGDCNPLKGCWEGARETPQLRWTPSKGNSLSARNSERWL